MAASTDSVGTSASTTLTAEQVSRTIDIGNLRGKVALITGASSGLGRAIAQAYAAAGAFVVNADLQPNPPHAPLLSAHDNFKATDMTTPTVELINARYASDGQGRPRASFTECNVTQPDSVAAAVALTAQTYGRLDVMVNNAGIAADASVPGRIHEQDVSVMDKNYAVNIKGVWLGCKYAIAQMMSQPPRPSGERGWIINMSSIAGLVGLSRSAAYCATKGAVLQLTKALAIDYARDSIHINSIHPGFIETSMLEVFRGVQDNKVMLSLAEQHPWGRLGMPEEIAKMAVFLAGDGASFITGAAFPVDGGYTAQ